VVLPDEYQDTGPRSGWRCRRCSAVESTTGSRCRRRPDSVDLRRRGRRDAAVHHRHLRRHSHAWARTGWRNPPRALYLANWGRPGQASRGGAGAAAPAGAEPGTIRCALLGDVGRSDWVAEHIARRYCEAGDAGTPVPTAAVLLRRNADAAPMADALTARGVPVEVVGLAGLLAVT
jgi:hypothetical protein